MAEILLLLFLALCFVTGAIVLSHSEGQPDEHADVEKAGMMRDELGIGK